MNDSELLTKIKDRLDAISMIGIDHEKGGWTRLAYTAEEDAVHQYAIDEYTRLGLDVSTDDFGNLFARDLNHRNVKTWLLGTHLDTVPQGGNFDGVVGFVAALTAYEYAVSKGANPCAELCVFRAEESTRFGKACLGSRLAFGKLSSFEVGKLLDGATDRRQDSQGGSVDNDSRKQAVSLRDILFSRGFSYRDDIEVRKKKKEDYKGYLEVHIEQARVLEMASERIGLVTSIRAPERRPFFVRGVRGVRGVRTVKSVAAMILAAEWNCRLAAVSGIDIVGTIGWVNGFFNNVEKINTVPGTVLFMLNAVPSALEKKFEQIKKGMDIGFVDVGKENALPGAVVKVMGTADHSGGTPMGRVYRRDALVAAAEMVLSADDDMIDNPEEIEFRLDIRSNDSSMRSIVLSQIINDFFKISSQFGTQLIVADPIEQTAPVDCLDNDLREKVKECAKRTGVRTYDVPSGAGHDAMIAHQTGIPSAMLFIPCKDGISHQKDESANTEDILLATKILGEFLICHQK
jgi:acetylornithine deacetylase/succinyl-diaminopimelate desuccinylase-like protein